jgi:hypothetical protein
MKCISRFYSSLVRWHLIYSTLEINFIFPRNHAINGGYWVEIKQMSKFQPLRNAIKSYWFWHFVRSIYIQRDFSQNITSPENSDIEYISMQNHVYLTLTKYLKFLMAVQPLATLIPFIRCSSLALTTIRSVIVHEAARKFTRNLTKFETACIFS